LNVGDWSRQWHCLLWRLMLLLSGHEKGKQVMLLVNVAGFNASLNWLNSCEWLNVFTKVGHLFIHVSEQRNAQEKKRVHETSLDQENTRLYRCGQRGMSTIDFASSQQGG
jgi:hypothetical protein